MRTIDEIKQVMCEEFMKNTTLAQMYGFTPGDTFVSHFNKTSIENLLLYIVAVGQYVLEALMNEHYTEVTEIIENTAVHRPKWYRDKVLSFMYVEGVEGNKKTLITDTDEYDTTGMSDGEIEAAHVVKYAAATETKDSALLTIKVAGESNGELCPLESEVERELEAYIAEIKDAGVRVSVVNQEADVFTCTVKAYHDAVVSADTIRERIKDAISTYIANLPFNGEYTNMALVDVLQQLDGVKIVEVRSSEVQVSGESTTTVIDARYRPVAGYMKLSKDFVDNANIELEVYDEQV